MLNRPAGNKNYGTRKHEGRKRNRGPYKIKKTIDRLLYFVFRDPYGSKAVEALSKHRLHQCSNGRQFAGIWPAALVPRSRQHLIETEAPPAALPDPGNALGVNAKPVPLAGAIGGAAPNFRRPSFPPNISQQARRSALGPPAALGCCSAIPAGV